MLIFFQGAEGNPQSKIIGIMREYQRGHVSFRLAIFALNDMWYDSSQRMNSLPLYFFIFFFHIFFLKRRNHYRIPIYNCFRFFAQSHWKTDFTLPPPAAQVTNVLVMLPQPRVSTSHQQSPFSCSQTPLLPNQSPEWARGVISSWGDVCSYWEFLWIDSKLTIQPPSLLPKLPSDIFYPFEVGTSSPASIQGLRFVFRVLPPYIVVRDWGNSTQYFWNTTPLLFLIST